MPHEHGLYNGRLRNAVGLLTELGDVPLASITPTTPGVDYLNKLSPPQKYADLVELIERISKGFTIGQFTYRPMSDVRLNTTYVLRSILYKRGGVMVFPGEPYHRLRLASLGYDGSDTLVAFRVVRRHEDGSLTILWKRLKSFEAAKIKDNYQQYAYGIIMQALEQQLIKGMNHAQVIAFLDTNKIEHTDFTEVAAKDGLRPQIKGVIFATIPHIERKLSAIFDLNIKLFFDDKKELVDWVAEKNRRG
jgi:hypothetical protein